MYSYGEVEAKLHTILSSAADEDEQWSSGCGLFTLGERTQY
jgi:hypothetical protein